MTRRELDADILRVAATQHGVVTRDQLYEAGADRSAVARRVASGMLEARSRRVFAVRAHPGGFEQDLWLAVLDCEGPSVVSHESAARLLRMTTFSAWREVVLTIPHGDKRTPLARCHQTRHALPTRAHGDAGDTGDRPGPDDRRPGDDPGGGARGCRAR